MRSLIIIAIMSAFSCTVYGQNNNYKMHYSADTAALFKQTYTAAVYVTPYNKDNLRRVSSREYFIPFGVKLYKYFQNDSVWYSILPYDATYTYYPDTPGASLTLYDETIIGGPDEKLMSGDVLRGHAYFISGEIEIDQAMVNKLCKVLIKEISVNGKRIEIRRKYAKQYKASFRAVSNTRNGIIKLKRVDGLP